MADPKPRTQNTSRARKVAPAFTTGGGGFAFETRVGAFVAAAMLAGEQPFGSDVGVPEKVRMQAAPLGHALDDLIVVGQDLRATRDARVLACSAKAYNMMPNGVLMGEFVAGAWRELLRDGFRDGHDRLGLICGRVGAGNLRALEQLVAAARADSDADLAARLPTKAFNKTHRSLWSSAKCPTEIADEREIDRDLSPARLLRHLVIRRFDLEAPDSEDSARARAWCQTALVPAQTDRAHEMLDALLQAVEQARTVGGSLTLGDLAELRPGLQIRARPDVEAAWAPLGEASDRAMAEVRDTLGAGTRLPRDQAWATLQQAPTGPVCVLTGPSGCGKSALAKRWATDDGNARTLWLRALDLEDGVDGLRTRLGLPVSVPWLLQHSPGRTRIVIDGLDRSFSQSSLVAAAELASIAATSAGRNELLVPCQQLAVARVLRELMSRGIDPGRPVLIGDLDNADLAILAGQPQVARLLVDGRLREVLRRPKLLDLVLQAAQLGVAELGQLRDETDVADLWWSEIAAGAGPDRVVRSTLLQELATRQADALRPATPAVELGAAAVDSVPVLQASGALAADDVQLAFAHDLFGDWSRLKRLQAEGDRVVAFLPGRELLPPWHRAVRLFALWLLRRDGEAWERTRAALDASGHRLLGDLFLDAVMFADDAGALLDALWERLSADSGALLRRLLTRFLGVATVPDPRGAQIFPDDPALQLYFASRNRVPLWPLWPPVLESLASRADEAVALAGEPAARVAELWLRFSEPGWEAREAAAEIGLAAGRHAINERTAGTYFGEDLELALYRAALSAGTVVPDRVLALLGGALTVSAEEIEERAQARHFEGLPPSVVAAMREQSQPNEVHNVTMDAEAATEPREPPPEAGTEDGSAPTEGI